MKNKSRKRTMCFAILLNILFIVISGLTLGDSKTVVLFMLIATPLFTVIGTVLPSLDKLFWGSIANFLYILAASLSAIVIIFGGLSIVKMMNLNQFGLATDYLLNFSIVVYGCYGLLVVLLGRAYRIHPFWFRDETGNKRNTDKNHLGLRKISGFTGYNNQTDQLK